MLKTWIKSDVHGKLKKLEEATTVWMAVYVSIGTGFASADHMHTPSYSVIYSSSDSEV